MSDTLHIEIRADRADACTILVSGRLDGATYSSLDEAFGDVMAEGYKEITVDLAGVDYISSAAFGVFMEAMATVGDAGGEIRFVNPSLRARKMFKMLGVLLDACQFE